MPEQPSVPSAPYPPMHSVSPARSSLSGSPHYRTTSRGTEESSPGTSSTNTSNLNNSSPVTAATTIRETFSDAESESLAAARPQFLDAVAGQQVNKSARPSLASVSKIKFYPSRCGTLACINTASTTKPHSSALVVEAVDHHGDETQRHRKLGPVLLELRQLELAEDENSREEALFETRTIALSRGNPQLGVSVSSTCLDLPVVQTYYSGQTNTLNPRFAAATGLTTGMLAIHTFSEVSGSEDYPYSSGIEYYHVSRHHRQSSAVAWRPSQTNHVAIGLLGSGTPGPQQGAPLPRRGGSTIRGSGGGDREFCCFIWDIEAQQSAAKRNAAPIAKLSHNTPVASLAWVMDGQTLAVGTQSRNVQLYDMRVSGTNAPPLSALAHNFGVHGIEVDPHKPNIMATFCRSIGEPVKLWDVRRMDSVVSEIKISNSAAGRTSQTSSSSQYSNQIKVETVQFSVAEPGVLSVAIGECVQDYDTSSGSRPVLVQVNYARKGRSILDIALCRGPTIATSTITKAPNTTQPDKNEKSISGRLLNDLYSGRRLVVMLEDRTLCDLAKHGGAAPVAISRRDGRVVHSLGSTVWVGSTVSGPTAMESSNVGHDEDISATMMRRARCFRLSRYSMNTSQNIKMLSEDIPSGADANKEILLSKLSLFRLWVWIERAEALSSESEETEDESSSWPARSLVDSGIVQLIDRDGASVRDEVSFSEALSCSVYSSPARHVALTSCGWAGKFSLDIVLAECEALGEYERSAALAVWHGDIGAAVEALQRASAAVRDHLAGKRYSDFATTEYADTLDLIAMCIAGYGGTAAAQKSVWQNACSKLLQRNDLSSPEAKTSRTAYLRALCKFLLNVGMEKGFDYILENEYLAYGDRIAFACRFLDQDRLQAHLFKCLERCQQVGNVEGLVISGLSKEGIKILQAFVDRTSDVQTAALVVSRVLLPQDWALERKVCMEWVESYRSLLNTWQMWQSRAMFDVDRAEALRRVKAKGGDLGGGVARRMQNRRQGSRIADQDVLSSIPAALDARCNYCSSSLALKRHEGNANQWLSKMKPVLSCCPQCRKPLPRCAICLLSLGALNPYMQLTRERSRPTPRGGNSTNTQDNLGALPLAEWFTWCMNCKHGGHAHHLVGWFADHETCPVSGCECHCQFDALQKLSRPALTKKLEGSELIDDS